MSGSKIPESYHTVTPYLAIHGLSGLLEFVQADADSLFEAAIAAGGTEVRGVQD